MHTWQVTPAAAAVSNVIPHPTNQELVVVGDDITFISVDTGIFETFKSSAAGVFTSYPCTGLPSPTANIRANILWNGTEFIGLFGFDTSSGYGSSCDNYIGRSADGIAWTDVTQLAGNTCLGAVTAVCGCFLSVSGDQAELICIAAAIATNPCGSFPAPKPKPAIPPDAMLPMSCHSIRVADLIQHLHRVFDQEPHSELLFRLTYNGGMTWKIVDGTLTTSVTGGTGANLAINLSGHTLATLIGSLSLQTGYSITFSNADYVDFSALILLDASGDIYASNGDHFYGYTSLLWSYFSALAIELDYASTEICEMLRQMSVRTAEDFWLDELGSYYKVPRLAAEPDVVYGPRIISETLRPKGNNGAIAAAIIEATGQAARVIDAATLAPVNTLYDGTFLHDASHIHDGIDPNSLYGLFDVEVQFDLLGSGDIAQFMADIIEQVERLRDAGTFLHQIKIGTCSALVENYSAPISDSATLQIMDAIYHNAAYSHNGIANYGGVMRPLEWLS